jgi:hypothetical protein
MYEPTLSMTVPLQSARPQSADISLLHATRFGALVPPLLSTVAFALLSVANFSEFPFCLDLLSMTLFLYLYAVPICLPFGVFLPFFVDFLRESGCDEAIASLMCKLG